ncbi:PilZ domain-containing protein [Alkalihalobacillus sp. MEB130]|uniref:PilZ domain-containing protein n=1 Tax=Alkalihalobacillus sp. MEB130 TaxID=2976704 RepID=UPI0028DEF88A|nr:PilZ domain-containing protein [Alkalihalobacillus sp. MEB130]MDT8861698.1 PilZ domain-containing protein [Alkalihalobacillus sp. MEB130]
MPYRRKEAFRYAFKQPIIGKFKLIKLANKEVSSSEGQLKILDISRGGLRGNSTLSLPDPKLAHTSMEIDFKLNSNNVILIGTIVWKKTLAHSFEYGIEFTSNEQERTYLLDEIKKFVRENKE